jgi:glutathione S-transferase
VLLPILGRALPFLEELGVPYKTIFLNFDDGENGVEGPDFVKRNPASQVPLVYDLKLVS